MYSSSGIPFQKIFFRTDGQTDGRSDFIMPQILFGGIKVVPSSLRYRDLTVFANRLDKIADTTFVEPDLGSSLFVLSTILF